MPFSSQAYDPFIVATITDDQLLKGSTYQISNPSASERLNHCTVTFANESNNFKDDTVSWPSKTTYSYPVGVGGKFYPSPLEPIEGETDRVEFLNKYGVWSGLATNNNPILTWRFYTKEAGNHSLRFAADDSGIIRISLPSGTLIHNTSAENSTVSLLANTEYIITIIANNSGDDDKQAAAAGLLRHVQSGVTIWHSTMESYDYFEIVQNSNNVYLQYLAEDNNIPLEASIDFEGCTDYYHALAKAEEMVRTSRTASAISFTYVIREIFLEPGDLIKIESDYLQIQELYVRVDEVAVKEDGTCEVKGSMFSFDQLAWNVNDTEAVSSTLQIDNTVPAVTNLFVDSVNSGDYLMSSGRITWTAPRYDGIVGYIVYMATADQIDSNGLPIFREIGRTNETFFNFQPLIVESAIFGVKTLHRTGKTSIMRTTGENAVVISQGDIPPTPTTVNLELLQDKVRITWNYPTTRANNTKYDDHKASLVYRSENGQFNGAIQIATVSENVFSDPIVKSGTFTYFVALQSLRNVTGSAKISENSVTVFSRNENGLIDLSPPPTPSNFTISSSFQNIIINFTSPPAYTQGNGHGRTLVYFKEVTSETDVVSTNDATLLTSFVENFVFIPTEYSTKYRIWLRFESKDKGISAFSSSVYVETGANIEALQRALTDAISEEQLTDTLSKRIDLIDNDSEVNSVGYRLNQLQQTVTQEINSSNATLSGQIAALDQELSGNINSLGSTIYTMQQQDTNFASQLNNLTVITNETKNSVSTLQQVSNTQASSLAVLSTESGDSRARIATLETTNATQAQSITDLSVRAGANESSINQLLSVTSSQSLLINTLNTETDTASNNITILFQTTANQANSLSSLTTRANNAESAITSLNTTTASQANSLSSLTTRVNNAESSITSLNTTTTNQANSLSSLTTRVNNAESSITSLNTTTASQASSILNINSRLNNINGVSIEQKLTTVTNDINSLYGEYTLRIDVNGRISGFGLASDNNTSNFSVLANKFFISSPDGTNSGTTPFVVVTTPFVNNGVNVPAGTYIANGFIANGSITNALIANATIDDAKIANLNAQKIVAGTITTDKLQVNSASALLVSENLTFMDITVMPMVDYYKNLNGLTDDQASNGIGLNNAFNQSAGSIAWISSDSLTSHTYPLYTSILEDPNALAKPSPNPAYVYNGASFKTAAIHFRGSLQPAFVNAASEIDLVAGRKYIIALDIEYTYALRGSPSGYLARRNNTTDNSTTTAKFNRPLVRSYTRVGFRSVSTSQIRYDLNPDGIQDNVLLIRNDEAVPTTGFYATYVSGGTTYNLFPSKDNTGFLNTQKSALTRTFVATTSERVKLHCYFECMAFDMEGAGINAILTTSPKTESGFATRDTFRAKVGINYTLFENKV